MQMEQTVENDDSIATVCEDDLGDLKLPTVVDLPDSDVVIFDGNCKFCQAQVRRLNWFDGGRLAYVSLHNPVVRDLCPELDKDALMKQMYVVSRKGETNNVFGGAKALRYLSRKLPRLWLAAPALHIPFTLPIWQFLYNQVANRRYRIAGHVSDCDEGCQI